MSELFEQLAMSAGRARRRASAWRLACVVVGPLLVVGGGVLACFHWAGAICVAGAVVWMVFAWRRQQFHWLHSEYQMERALEEWEIRFREVKG